MVSRILMSLTLVALLSSCSAKQNTAPENITFLPPSTVSEADETLLLQCFQESTVPWQTRTLTEVRSARATIAEEEKYLLSRVVSGELAVSTYIEGISRLVYQYQRLRNGLDNRVSVEGAVDPVCTRLYELTRDTIVAQLNAMQKQILVGVSTTSEGNINADTLAKLKDVYTLVKPLIAAYTSGGTSVIGDLL